MRQIVREVGREPPEIVMAGHAGSTPAHPVTVRMFRAIKEAFPQTITVYGGVYPSYHAIEILEQEPSVDFVIRGEGEATAAELVDVLSSPGQLPSQLGPRMLMESAFAVAPLWHSRPRLCWTEGPG